MSLLEVRDLTVTVATASGPTTIVDGVTFDVQERSSVALVGESGSGKSLTAFSVLGLLPPGAHIASGSVRFEDKDLTTMRDRDLRKLRGARIAMVFQEPSIALNPVYTVGSQVAETLLLHGKTSRKEARAAAEKWLGKVGMPAPKRAMESYPHELSGGMKQRVLLAIALVGEPALLIADEPTSSLDRTLEAQILEVLDGERRDRGMSLLLVSHDLATVARSAEHTLVFYAGQIVERAKTSELLAKPAHPYSNALLASVPERASRTPRVLGGKAPRLPVLAGSPPRFNELPPGCRFAPRCEHVFDRCNEEKPPLYEVDGRGVRCFLFDDSSNETQKSRVIRLTEEPPEPDLPPDDEEEPG